MYKKLMNIKKQINKNDKLVLYTYNVSTGTYGVANFCGDNKHVKVYEGKSDGSNDKIITYDEFIRNYRFKIDYEMSKPFENIKI